MGLFYNAPEPTRGLSKWHWATKFSFVSASAVSSPYSMMPQSSTSCTSLTFYSNTRYINPRFTYLLTYPDRSLAVCVLYKFNLFQGAAATRSTTDLDEYDWFRWRLSHVTGLAATLAERPISRHRVLQSGNVSFKRTVNYTI